MKVSMEPFKPDEVTPATGGDVWQGRTLEVGPVRVAFENRATLRERLAATGKGAELAAKVNAAPPTDQELVVTVHDREPGGAATVAASKEALRVWIGPKGKLPAAWVALDEGLPWRLGKVKFAPNEVDLFRAIGIEEIYVAVDMPGLVKRVRMPESMRRALAREMRHPLDKRELPIP